MDVVSYMCAMLAWTCEISQYVSERDFTAAVKVTKQNKSRIIKVKVNEIFTLGPTESFSVWIHVLLAWFDAEFKTYMYVCVYVCIYMHVCK